MMSFLKLFIVNLLALTAIAVTNTRADQVDLIKKMMSGVNILMIRHAYVPGSGDPDNFKVGDYTAQRNLDDRGVNRHDPSETGFAQKESKRLESIPASGADAWKQQDC